MYCGAEPDLSHFLVGVCGEYTQVSHVGLISRNITMPVKALVDSSKHWRVLLYLHQQREHPVTRFTRVSLGLLQVWRSLLGAHIDFLHLRAG